VGRNLKELAALLKKQVSGTEMARLVEAIPGSGETKDLHWIARRMAYEIDRRRLGFDRPACKCGFKDVVCAEMSNLEEKFHELGQELIEKAGKVRCSAADYRCGLRGIIEDLQIEIQASEECEGGDL